MIFQGYPVEEINSTHRNLLSLLLFSERMSTLLGIIQIKKLKNIPISFSYNQNSLFVGWLVEFLTQITHSSFPYNNNFTLLHFTYATILFSDEFLCPPSGKLAFLFFPYEHCHKLHMALSTSLKTCMEWKLSPISSSQTPVLLLEVSVAAGQTSHLLFTLKAGGQYLGRNMSFPTSQVTCTSQSKCPRIQATANSDLVSILDGIAS